jgi:excinuclease ABC subunit C
MQVTSLPRTPRAAVAQLPSEPGVYRFRDVDNRVLYIGRAINLRRRVGSYWSSLGVDRRLLRMVSSIARIEAVVCDSEHEACWLERNLLEQWLPRWNKTAGGQEVPVWIRLSQRSAAPGLSVVHSVGTDAGGGLPGPDAREASADARIFGPYLGGNKVRLAVAGLHRVMPLAYCGEKMSGSARDMARMRGVEPSAREALVGTVSAVLERDPVAIASVRAQLTSRRDAAAQLLDFERAARIQTEIDGFDWVVSPQRITASAPEDHDVYGWHDGILVHFQIRAGRLCTWRQRPGAGPAAQRRISINPTHWQEFARRNAELAARLSRCLLTSTQH